MNYINLKLFETKINNLGIPDKISLGSFENISNNEEEVFIFTPKKKLEDQKYYFRVKAFNILDLEKNWISTDHVSLLNQFSNDLKIKNTEINKEKFGKIILYPHEKKWIPKLSNYNYKNQSLTINIIDNLTYSKNKIIRKTPLDLHYQKIEYSYNEELIKFSANIEEVCVKTVESGSMTKDLAVLIDRSAKYLTTNQFLEAIDRNI